MQIITKHIKLELSSDGRRLEKLLCGTRELLSAKQDPLFTLALRDRSGEMRVFNADNAGTVQKETSDDTIILHFSDFEADFRVMVSIRGGESIVWKAAVENATDYAVESIDFPSITFAGGLKENGGDGSVLLAYNEGALITDGRLKQTMTDPVYPSLGSYMMFPNMIFSQFTLYLFSGGGIYMGMQDPARAPKGIDFACTDAGTTFRTRLFMGGDFGESVQTDYDIVWQSFTGDWHDGAEIYRTWFEANLPSGLKPVDGNASLPEWYRKDMPLVVTYPVRGIHDMDEMTPNRLFPYTNALPIVDEFAKRTDSTVLALLMHWEGSAPWAPPYVWPPYGGEAALTEFREKLHARGDLLGVYCSGFGYTDQSNLIADYTMRSEFDRRGLADGMCVAPDGTLPHSRICTGQRSGYDICPASPIGHDILEEALSPLLDSGIDYAQALDQNHGGGMYLCYSKEHGHAPVPGAWMTHATGDLLAEWRERVPAMLLGCESAAAEPFLASLPLSDNRYELNYAIGTPVPLYAYLYHPYLHNFMGNQVSCPFQYTTVGLNCRIAYSFLAGDLITFVINDVGEIMFAWGMRDFSRNPDRDAVIGFASDLHRWHKRYPSVFSGGRMVKPLTYDCADCYHPLWDGRLHREQAVLSTAWQFADRSVQLFANYTDEPQLVKLTLCDGVRAVLVTDTETHCSGEVTFTLPARASCALEY